MFWAVIVSFFVLNGGHIQYLWSPWALFPTIMIYVAAVLFTHGGKFNGASGSQQDIYGAGKLALGISVAVIVCMHLAIALPFIKDLEKAGMIMAVCSGAVFNSLAIFAGYFAPRKVCLQGK